MTSLKALDPEAAAEIHPNNLVRVIRALEVCTLTGKTFTACKAESHQIPSPYQSLIIGLTYERSVLYERINTRVDQMIEQGMIEEAYHVYQNEALRTAYHAIGYKELIPYFEKKDAIAGVYRQNQTGNPQICQKTVDMVPQK